MVSEQISVNFFVSLSRVCFHIFNGVGPDPYANPIQSIPVLEPIKKTFDVKTIFSGVAYQNQYYRYWYCFQATFSKPNCFQKLRIENSNVFLNTKSRAPRYSDLAADEKCRGSATLNTTVSHKTDSKHSFSWAFSCFFPSPPFSMVARASLSSLTTSVGVLEDFPNRGILSSLV